MGYIEDLKREMETIYKSKGAPFNLAAFSYIHLKEFLASNGIKIDVFIAELLFHTDKRRDSVLRVNYETVWRKLISDIREVLNESAAGQGIAKDQSVIGKIRYMEIPGIIEETIKGLKPIPFKRSIRRVIETYNEKNENASETDNKKEIPCRLSDEEHKTVPNPDNKIDLLSEISQEMAAYFVIKAVGEFADQKEHDNRFSIIEQGDSEKGVHDEPLNTVYTEKVKVFRRPSRKNIWQFTGGIMPVERADTSTTMGINSDIRGIVLFELPNDNINIRYCSDLSLNEKIKQTGSSVRIKVMVVPFIGEIGATDFDQQTGLAFRVTHKEGYDEHAKILVEKYMTLAKQKKVNIVVLPEFMISAPVLDHLKKFIHDSSMRDLLFVVAGSGWSEDDNNVSKILDCYGNEIACTYKSNGFRRWEEKEADIDKEAFKEEETGENVEAVKDGESAKKEVVLVKKGFYEALTEPGKTIDILDYEGIGRVSNLICRDIYDDRYDAVVKKISDLFEPHFFFIPAWSTSTMKAFCNGCEKLAVHGAVSVTANCCEALLLNNKSVMEEKNKDGGLGEDVVLTNRKPQKRGLCVFPTGGTKSGYNKPSVDCFICGQGSGITCDDKYCAFIMTMKFSKDSFDRGNYIEGGSFRHYIIHIDPNEKNHDNVKVVKSSVLSSSSVSKWSTAD